ncbi:DUF4241 domain-containing protein [Aridibaculum aurantiacum]|uniref:DUF4241 domain-containing protein n=1 Tax=Aridibaculum aurantiacum TaxID=2810307 RepID=UPI001A95AB23|nr:DUF4241 domain-containing protein [Aridibaculum aurantiacum]
MRYIFIALAFFACKIGAPKNDTPISTEKLDTITSTPPAIIAQPALFEKAFIKGTTEKGRTQDINLYGVTIGKLKITTGRIVACDPLHIDEYGLPFTQVFPTGEFPVQLSIAGVEGEEMVAFARIKFSDEPVVKWELALLEGQKPLPVGDEEIHGYGVDAGVGIFMDQDAIKGLNPKQIWEMESKHELFKEMDKHYHPDWRYTMYSFGSYNLAAFTTGVGDGRYATYIGYDAAGNPCRLTTDFKLFDWKNK